MKEKAMDVNRTQTASFGGDVEVIEHMLATGEIVAAQVPSSSNWTPEKRLAAAVLLSALIEVREYSGSQRRRQKRLVRETMEWINSDEGEWPFSFLRLCEIFRLEPDAVRERARHWYDNPPGRSRRAASAYRNAA